MRQLGIFSRISLISSLTTDQPRIYLLLAPKERAELRTETQELREACAKERDLSHAWYVEAEHLKSDLKKAEQNTVYAEETYAEELDKLDDKWNQECDQTWTENRHKVGSFFFISMFPQIYVLFFVFEA